MSRELKFRAWHETDKCWYNPRFIEMNLLGQAILHHDIEQFEIIPASAIGQYTGLKDKNGKEIYEGDIVRQVGGNLVCVVEFKYGGFLPFTADTMTFDVDYCEVIGNIHENPELLGGEE